MKFFHQSARRILFVALLAAFGTAVYANSNGIFCDSFESSSTSCAANTGTGEPQAGTNGNLWDQMHWDEGTWD